MTQAVVIGAGPAGLTAALALNACGAEVAIAAPAFDAARADADRRTTALLPGSIELLKNLGVWEHVREHSALLEGVRIVDDRGGLLARAGGAVPGQRAGPAVLRRQRRQRAPQRRALRARPRRGRPELAADVGRRRGRARRDGMSPSSSPKAVRCGRFSPSPPMAAPPSRARRRALPRGPGATRRRRLPPPSATRARTRGSPPSCTAAPGPLTTVPLPGDASSLVWVEEPAAAARLAGPGRKGLPGRAGGAPAGVAGLARRRRPARGVSAGRARGPAHGPEPRRPGG